ncbi:MAG: MFS transporter [Chloroflexota bacterium]|nr:MAG: MFS transporter [Bellilinea sp.]
MNLKKLFSNPAELNEIQSKNFTNVQIDAIGVGLANAAAPFLPVFLTRLGATSYEIGLLTSMPALAGLILAIPMGQFLQNQKRIIPWFSFARLGVIMSYALTGLLAFFLQGQTLISGILIVWALATIPQTLLNISFSVVMNAVAGPNLRYELMTRRWSILGITTAVAVFIIGQFLDRIVFPTNFQAIFIFLSVGGLISYYFSSHIQLPDFQSPTLSGKVPLRQTIAQYLALLSREKPFQSFVIKRFVFLSGAALTLPLFPLYFVREVQASNSWIATINTAQTAIVIVGYFFWTQQSRRRGSRQVLLWTTLGAAIYPILVASTHNALLITIFAGINGIFQAGLNLVFFDELMKTVPPEYSATFVSIAQGLQYVSSILSPLIGTFIADVAGIGNALIIGGLLQFIGFLMFWRNRQLTVIHNQPQQEA